MTPDEYRRHACERKIPYLTRRETRQVMRDMGRPNGGLHAYHCEFADHWHIGHGGSRKARRSRHG